MDDISLGLMMVAPNTIRAMAFLRHEQTLQNRGITIERATAEDSSLMESVDVHSTDEGGVTVLDVLIDTDKYALERAMEIVIMGALTISRSAS